MKTRNTFKLLLLVSLATFVAGCATDPRERYAQAEQSLATAADATKAAVDAGVVTDPNTLLALREALSEGNTQLAKAHDLVIAGQPVDAKFYSDAAFSAAQRVLQYLSDAEAAKKASKQ